MFQFKWSRMLAVAERDLRRFRRNTTLMIPMALMPIIYLVILGKAMGGDLHDLRVAVVDEDRGPAAVVGCLSSTIPARSASMRSASAKSTCS